VPRNGALLERARAVLFLFFACLVGVFSHRLCVCLLAPLSHVQVAGVPAAGLRAAGASGLTSEGVWRLSPSSLYPPYRPVPCICAGWLCVCALPPGPPVLSPAALDTHAGLPQVWLRAKGGYGRCAIAVNSSLR
jgi:hypothetical protein